MLYIIVIPLPTDVSPVVSGKEAVHASMVSKSVGAMGIDVEDRSTAECVVELDVSNGGNGTITAGVNVEDASTMKSVVILDVSNGNSGAVGVTMESDVSSGSTVMALGLPLSFGGDWFAAGT